MSQESAVKAWAIEGPDGEIRFISFWPGEEMAWIDYINTFHLWNKTILNANGWKVLPGYRAAQVEVRKIAAGREDRDSGGRRASVTAQNPPLAPAAPDALADRFEHALTTYGFPESGLAREVIDALRQQRGEIPLSEEVRRILAESESWEDNRDVESPAAGWMLKVPQKLFIRMISALKERT